jgi:hypothetical protein
MDSTKIPEKDIHVIKTLVEKALGNIMRATIEVYPDDRRLMSIYNEMKEIDGDVKNIPEEEIEGCVKKHYVEGYVSTHAVTVVEDLSSVVCVFA